MIYRAVIAVLMLALMPTPAHDLFGQKKDKVKHKRYETVVKPNLKDYEGKYIGIETDYVIEIQVTADGSLRITSLEDGRSVTITNIKVTGAHLTADKIYADRQRGKLDATFSNRILNGESAFGLLVDGLNVHLDGGAVLNRVFYQRN